MEFIETGREDSRVFGMKPCESSYEFALRFTGEGDEFVITKDQLVIGCDVTACESADGKCGREDSGWKGRDHHFKRERGDRV